MTSSKVSTKAQTTKKCVYHNKSFLKAYNKLTDHNPHLQKIIDSKIKQFSLNPQDPNLRVHPLHGSMLNHFSFSINYDIRVIFYQTPKTIILIDIGLHSRVYN